MTVSLPALALLLLPAAAPSGTVDRAEADDRARICRWVETTQARFGQPVCLSVAEWRRIDVKHPSDLVGAGMEPRLRSKS